MRFFLRFFLKRRARCLELEMVELKAIYDERIRLHGTGAYIWARELAELHGKISAIQWELANLRDEANK